MYLALFIAAAPLGSAGLLSFDFKPVQRLNPAAADDSLFFPHADFLNDINMDISFNDMNIPFAPLLNFAGPQAPLPLYLMVDPQQSDDQQPRMTSSMFVLEHTDQINGNTHRYTVRSNGGKKFITETWSKPKKMYLCSDEACQRDTGMEVMNILDEVLDGMQAMRYMHLVPTSTLAEDEVEAGAAEGVVESNMEDDIDMQYDAYDVYDTYQTYVRSALDTMRGCHHRMKQMMGYGDNDDEQMMPMMASRPEIEIIVNGRDRSMNMDDEALDTDSEIYVDEAEYSEVLFAFHVLTTLCLFGGVLFLCIAFCMRRKTKQPPKKKEMEGYVVMEETDQFTFR